MQPTFDVLIAGGGMVGASLAVALKDLSLKVAMVEAHPFSDQQQPAYDDRAIALSYGSRQILQGMGVWSAIKAAATPIERIHVSDRGHLGATRLSAKQQRVEALGYLIQSRLYGEVMRDVLEASDITLIQPASVSSVESSVDHMTVKIQTMPMSAKVSADQVLQTRLLVVCDGAQSKVRDMLGVEVSTHDYQQVAVIANISTEKPHQNQAFERFTKQGPIALLPMSEGRSSLVWTLHRDCYQQVMDLSESEFLKALGEAFGYRLGRFTKAGVRSAFPLQLTQAKQLTTGRAAVIGNAAHALHPVAGQGLNLALRDIADLAEQVAMAAEAGTDTGSPALLNVYEAQRSADTQRTVQYTHSLVKLFSNEQAALGHARAAGLMLVDRVPFLRNKLARQSMGLGSCHSRLARGLPLLKGMH